VGSVERSSNAHNYRRRSSLQRLMISHVVLMILVSGFLLGWLALRCVFIQYWDLERRDGVGEHWFAWFSFLASFVLVFCLA
jgi:hypothetical protein